MDGWVGVGGMVLRGDGWGRGKGRMRGWMVSADVVYATGINRGRDRDSMIELGETTELQLLKHIPPTTQQHIAFSIVMESQTHQLDHSQCNAPRYTISTC